MNTLAGSQPVTIPKWKIALGWILYGLWILVVCWGVLYIPGVSHFVWAQVVVAGALITTTGMIGSNVIEPPHPLKYARDDFVFWGMCAIGGAALGLMAEILASLLVGFTWLLHHYTVGPWILGWSLVFLALEEILIPVIVDAPSAGGDN